MAENTLSVGRIKEGFVLDHIQAGKSMEIYKYLNLDKLDCSVAILKNVPSEKLGRKDIIKIDAEITLDVDVLGYLAPACTVNVIKDGIATEKSHLQLPKQLINVIPCRNPRCITTIEQELPHVFKLVDADKGVYRCIYCEAQA